MKPDRQIPALALSMDDIGRAMGVSKPIVYQLIESGVLRTFVIGKRRLATPEAIGEALRTLEASAAPMPAATPHNRRATVAA
jgi:hypothetical protein